MMSADRHPGLADLVSRKLGRHPGLADLVSRKLGDRHVPGCNTAPPNVKAGASKTEPPRSTQPVASTLAIASGEGPTCRPAASHRTTCNGEPHPFAREAMGSQPPMDLRRPPVRSQALSLGKTDGTRTS